MPRPSVIDRARVDLERGEPWRARDRLNGAFATDRTRPELVEPLGEVYATMGDLPAAGRWWYLGEGDTERHRLARAAFEARCGGQADQIRRGLPAIGESFPLGPSARARVDAVGGPRRPRQPVYHPPPSASSRLGEAAGAAGCLAVVVALVAPWSVGAVELLRRLWGD